MAENREYQKAIDYLCGLIEEKKISIGDRLPTERKMAETLSIGRNSTREALKMLEKLGMVESRQGSGNYLAANMSGTISKCIEMMILLNQTSQEEVIAFRRELDFIICKEIISKDTVPRWENQLKNILTVEWGSLSHDEQVELDRKIHFTLIQASENSLWICIAEAIASVYRKWIDCAIGKAEQDVLRKMQNTHYEMVSALLERNLQRCEKAINTHYDLIDGVFGLQPDNKTGGKIQVVAIK